MLAPVSTPFLTAFAQALVARLVAQELLEIEGPPGVVALFLAAKLDERKPGMQLISTISTGLIACPEVVDLFADDDQIKEIVYAFHTAAKTYTSRGQGCLYLDSTWFLGWAYVL